MNTVKVKKKRTFAKWLLDVWPDILILAVLFGLMFSWMTLPGLRGIGGPDEPMRFDVVEWLYAHPGQLPRGDLPELLDPNWGSSYAFYPILSYMVSALFMNVASLFTSDPEILKLAARMAPVLFLTLAAWFTIMAGKRLFGKETGRLFACLVVFMPGYHYLGTYVNNDSFALLCAAMILYAWTIALTEGWNRRSCGLLSVGMGLCFLSYYNAYGWILFSFIFFCATILICQNRPMKERVAELFKKGIPIALITLALCAWWFIRNAILYDGDFSGRKTFTITQDRYAIPELRSKNRPSMRDRGWSFFELCLYQDPGWPHNWFVLSLVSFVGTFGIFDLYMDETVSKLYILVIAFFFIACIVLLSPFSLHSRKVRTEQKTTGAQRITVKTITRERAYSKEGFFNLCMLGALITPYIIFAYYAYTIDLQAQGRYFINAVYPLMYFVTLGIRAVCDRVCSSDLMRRLVPTLLAAAWTIAAVLNYMLIVVPAYS